MLWFLFYNRIDLHFIRRAASSHHPAGHCHGSHVFNVLNGQQFFCHLVCHFPGICKGRPLFCCHSQADLCAFHLRHERGSIRQCQHSADHKKHNTSDQDSRFPSERFPYKLLISCLQMDKDSAFFLLRFSKHPGRHHRHKRQCHKQARQQGIGDGKPHIHKELSRNPLCEHNRRKHTDRCKCRCRNCSRHLPCPLDCRFFRRDSFFIPHPVDVLNDDNGVVNQHPHSKRKPGQ